MTEAPTGLQSDGSANGEPDFNGAQLQAVSIDPVTLTQGVNGSGQLTLTWANYGTLMTSSNLATGSWTPVAGAVSPFTISPTNAAGFYRVQIH